MHFPKTGTVPSLATENRHLSVKLFSSHLTVELSITVDTSSAYGDMQMVENSNLTKSCLSN